MKNNNGLSALYFWALVFLVISSNYAIDGQNVQYKLCTSTDFLASCETMQNVTGITNLMCIGANDKIGCIEKVVRNEADLIILDPEEIYVANKFQPKGFIAISELRSDEFKNRDYRYEPVAVVKKSANIKSIQDLQGKKSCHTGFGRTAGWKIPFSHLMDRNQLPKYCMDIEATTPERDLYAISKFFGSACAPGTWVPEKETEKQLKKTYSNLCELCDDPSTCTRADKYGGYEGALNCLVLKDADVAWTKMDAVESYFKLNTGSPLPSAKNYELLCWDGNTVPLTSKTQCSWTKRPWPALVASNRLSISQIKEVQDTVSELEKKGVEESKTTNVVPEWLTKVLEIKWDDKSSTFDTVFHNEAHFAKINSPIVYLNRGKNYTVTIEKPSCASENFIRFCVKSEVEKSKCLDLQLAAMGRRILPRVKCVLAENDLDCIQKVATGEADLVALDAKDADWAQRNYELKPILSELEENKGAVVPYRYALAVIRKGDSHTFKNISSLRGKRSCHGSIRSLAGWNVPLSTLRDLGEIAGPTCGLTLQMASYFGNKSCVPGIKDWAVSSRMPWLPVKSYCSLCAGDGPGPGQALLAETMCSNSDSERYFDDTGAIRCLKDNTADVAFVDNVGLLKEALESKEFQPENFQLLCPRGGTADLDNYLHCHWGPIPSRKILTRSTDDDKIRREDVKLTLLKISDTFNPTSKTSNVLKLFGPYFGNKNLLFQDTSVGLCDINNASDMENNNLISDFDYCTTSSATLTSGVTMVTILLTSIFAKLHVY